MSTHLVHMICHHQSRIGSQKPCNVSFLVARDENANFFLSQLVCIDLNVIQKVSSNDNITAVAYSSKGLSSQPAAGIVVNISEAKVIIGWGQLRHGQDGDLMVDYRNFEGGGWSLLDLKVIEYLYVRVRECLGSSNNKPKQGMEQKQKNRKTQNMIVTHISYSQQQTESRNNLDIPRWLLKLAIRRRRTSPISPRSTALKK